MRDPARPWPAATFGMVERHQPERFRADLPKPAGKRYCFFRAATVEVAVARAATVAVVVSSAQRQLPLQLPAQRQLPLPLPLPLPLSLTWAPVEGDTSLVPKSDEEASAV